MKVKECTHFICKNIFKALLKILPWCLKFDLFSNSCICVDEIVDKHFKCTHETTFSDLKRDFLKKVLLQIAFKSYLGELTVPFDVVVHGQQLGQNWKFRPKGKICGYRQNEENAIFGAISGQRQKIGNVFFASALDFLCIYYVQNSRSLSATVLVAQGVPIHINSHDWLLSCSYDVIIHPERPVSASLKIL